MARLLFGSHTALRWSALLLGSAILGGALTSLHFPAAALLGCMLGGILLSSRGVELAIPVPLFALAQGVLGCLMARSLQPSILLRVASDWPVFIGATVSVIAASAALGWILMWRRTFPGTTAVWGLAPGAASAMVVMAGDYGADVRLVAFMQYLRVALVTALASLVARFWGLHAVSTVSEIPWLAAVHPADLAWTCVIAFGGSSVARWLRIPAGAMMAPLVLATGLQGLGLVAIELPPILLVVAYALIGWSIGLRFTAAILRHALRALPEVLGAIFALIAVGVAIAWGLTQVAGLDPLTAYLATSPGGADSVAVIAATSAVDAGFVMAMQVARFVMVLIFGPHVSRRVASRWAVENSPTGVIQSAKKVSSVGNRSDP